MSSSAAWLCKSGASPGSRSTSISPCKAIRVCSAEDLIIHKAIAGRPQDVRDIEGIVYRQRVALDVAIIGRRLHAFTELLNNSEIVECFERPWQRIHPSEQRR